MKARVYVTLKSGVLDPAGKAVEAASHSLGFAEVGSVRIGKYFEIELQGDAKDAQARLESLSAELLANTVIEDFRVELA